MLRICLCLSHYHPIASGAERQAHLQAKELVRRGHRVHVITRAVPDCPEREDLDGVSVHRMIRPRELGPIFGATFVSTLCTALQRLRNEYDILHCHQGLWEAVATGLVTRRLGKPSVVQPAAGGEFGEIHQWSRTRGRGMLRRFILRNSHFVAISRQIERELSGFGVPSDRLTRLASGVDTELFSPGASTRFQRFGSRPCVLFLGRLHSQKNLVRLLEAWAEVRKRSDAVLVLAGDGPQRIELTALARRLGIFNSVEFVGPVSDPVDYLRAASLLVLPSVAEGMSNSLLEAMAVGVPVVVSNIDGNTDLVSHGTTGLLVDPLNPSSIADGLVQLLSDGDNATKLGRAACELIRTSYSISAVVDRYVPLYQLLYERAHGTGQAGG